MSKGADIRESDFDAKRAWEKMVKRIRDEALEEVARVLESSETVMSGEDAAWWVRSFK